MFYLPSQPCYIMQAGHPLHESYLYCGGDLLALNQMVVNHVLLQNAQKEALMAQISKERKKNEQLNSKKEELDNAEEDSSFQCPKRFYSKRNPNLNKIYICQAEGCFRKYSSKTALASHQRHKHQSFRRQKRAN